MTEDQVAKWQAKRNAAKKIKNPKARQAALDVVYDMKDDMQLDCQRKMADRIKELKASDSEQSACLESVKASVEQVKRDFDAHMKACAEDHEVVEEVKAGKHRAHGFIAALKWLGYLVAAGGGSIATVLVKMAQQAGGAQ